MMEVLDPSAVSWWRRACEHQWGMGLRMECEPRPLLTAGAVLAVHSLPRLEQILELINFLWQPSSKFVSWKCRMSITLPPFLIPISRWLDFTVTTVWILCGFRQNSSSCSRWNCSADGGSINHCGRLRTSKPKSSGVRTERELLSSCSGVCAVFSEGLQGPGSRSWPGTGSCFPRCFGRDNASHYSIWMLSNGGLSCSAAD